MIRVKSEQIRHEEWIVQQGVNSNEGNNGKHKKKTSSFIRFARRANRSDIKSGLCSKESTRGQPKKVNERKKIKRKKPSQIEHGR
jgi:hypothetical protein